MWRSVWLLLAAAGCVTETIGVTPREILHHVPELRARGRATVATSSGTYELDASRTFEVTIGGAPRRISVREMLANCPEVAPFAGATFHRDPPCLLLDTTIDQLPLTTERHLSPDAKVAASAALGGLIVVTLLGTVAAFVCEKSATPCR
jgi:hypothetical protein